MSSTLYRMQYTIFSMMKYELNGEVPTDDFIDGKLTLHMKYHPGCIKCRS
ncbi:MULTISPECIES: hypothetical protein [Flavobacterium]|nr:MULTISPECIES: hypothetical protein [Flavobacterium]